MSKTLDVYFHEKIVGQLEQDNYGELGFTYSDDWLDDPNAVKISCSLPLRKKTFKKKECRGFFEGILPEDNQRKLIARNLGISPNNDFSMLEKIGGECAGALSFIPSSKKLNSYNEKSYYELENEKLPGLLSELMINPLLAGRKGVRLSLAGVQNKLAVYIEDNKIKIPLNNSPSTHILKPDLNTHDSVIYNEDFCLKLANEIGLSVAQTSIKHAGDINYLLIKRYDRILVDAKNNEQRIQRIHQEDFCQALGIPSSKKYQNEGGPSIKQCFELLRKESSIPVLELEKMMKAVIFNYLIGNCDAHGKNFSLLYLDKLQLAPLYDLICTVYYKEVSKKMAMKLGDEYQINNISYRNFDRLADVIKFSKPELRTLIHELIDSIIAALPLLKIDHPIQENIKMIIQKRCEQFM